MLSTDELNPSTPQKTATTLWHRAQGGGDASPFYWTKRTRESDMMTMPAMSHAVVLAWLGLGPGSGSGLGGLGLVRDRAGVRVRVRVSVRVRRGGLGLVRLGPGSGSGKG